MTYQEVSNLIDSIGLPCAYDHFTDDTGKELPFICFIYPESDDFIADNINYTKIRQLQIELYTENKDFALEDRIETILAGAGLVYNVNSGYLSDEQMYMTTYNTEVLINGES